MKQTAHAKPTIQFIYIFLLCGILVFFSSAVYLYNFFITQYPGINYCSIPMLIPAIQIAIAYTWYAFYCHGNKLPIEFIKESSLYFMIAILIAMASSAVQFTPFKPIDNWLIKIELFFHVDLETLLYWTNDHPIFKDCLSVIYNGITLELYLVPVTVLIMKQYAYVREFCFMLLATCILGYFFYYFFPTTAPASILNQELFEEEQIYTGLKFWQIHHYILPESSREGLIAMPSFHMIWGFLCTSIVRFNPTFFYFLLIYNTLMVLSCVLLGWHYPIDILSSILTLYLAYWLYYKLSAHSQIKLKTDSPLMRVNVTTKGG